MYQIFYFFPIYRPVCFDLQLTPGRDLMPNENGNILVCISKR